MKRNKKAKNHTAPIAAAGPVGCVGGSKGFTRSQEKMKSKKKSKKLKAPIAGAGPTLGCLGCPKGLTRRQGLLEHMLSCVLDQ